MISEYRDNQIDTPGEPTESGGRNRFHRIFDAVLMLLMVGAAGWIGWFGLKATRTVSRSLAGPDTVVRLQIVNATSDPRLGAAVAAQLTGYIDHAMSFAVVDTARFGARRVKESFVIAREDNKATAEAVAARLGLTPEKVTILPMEHNDRNAAVTLVLGDDYRMLALAPRNDKETQGKT
ncbi:MAG: LytR C-terminal domain-containing protein [candidate division Zixibacteria bacterium]|nr:LytR C-terminal domain-containing protein [candidate division Zixibacteria bacterium]